MPTYSSPIDNYRFLLREVLELDSEMTNLGKGEIDADLTVGIVEEAGRLDANRFHRLDSHGDEDGISVC